MTQPDFWSDQEQATAVGQELADLDAELATWSKLRDDVDDLQTMVELDADDQNVDLRLEAEQQLAVLQKRFAELEFFVLLDQPYDTYNALLSIHAGAGGVDAQDWADMLLRMYLRFCEQHHYKVVIVDQSRGEQNGLKSATLEINGRYAYGQLKSEHGVHRLVRISPFDAEKMRHTSFALVEVLPELASTQAQEIAVREEDLRIDVYRAGGKGGQGVNTTDSAVRITHLPTGLMAACQNERSQHQNKAKALQILKSRLLQYQQAQQEEERLRLRGEYSEAAWGNQIRSYVLHPYKMVKDHRTSQETSAVDNVLAGELTDFIASYLKYLKKK